MTLGDRQLLDRLEAGDDRALAGLYRRHHRGLLAFSRHLVGDQAKAEEAVRIAFDRLGARAAAGRAPVDARSALYRYARNACAAMPAAAGVSATGLPPMVREQPELQGLLRDMSRLSVDERAALVLFELRQLPEHEIAAVLGRQVNEVQALLTSARTALAQVSAETRTCEDVQAHLSTLHGRALIPMRMRVHIRQCDDCRRFKAALIAQRRGLAALLPLVPSATLAPSILGRGSGRTKSAAGAGAVAGLAVLARRARANPAAAGGTAAVAAAAVALSVGVLGGGDGGSPGGGGVGDGSPAGAVAGAEARSEGGAAKKGEIAAQAKPPTALDEALASLTPPAGAPGPPAGPDDEPAVDPAPRDDPPGHGPQRRDPPPDPTRPPPLSVDPGPGDPQPGPPAEAPDVPAPTSEQTPPGQLDPPPEAPPVPGPVLGPVGGPPGNPTAPGKGPGKMPPGTPGTPGPPGGSPGPPPGTPPNGG